MIDEKLKLPQLQVSSFAASSCCLAGRGAPLVTQSSGGGGEGGGGGEDCTLSSPAVLHSLLMPSGCGAGPDCALAWSGGDRNAGPELGPPWHLPLSIGLHVASLGSLAGGAQQPHLL